METRTPPRVVVRQAAEGKDLIIATRSYAQEQRARSWAHLGISVLVTVACYFGIFFLSPLWAKAIFGVLAGLSLVRLFILYHDHQHKTILNRSWLADSFFTVFGMFMLSPPSIWKRSHDHHHKHNSKLYTSSIGSFPVVTVEKFHTLTRGERLAYLFIRSPFAIAFGYIFVFIIGMCLNSFISNKGRHWDSLITLVLQGITLPFVVHWLKLEEVDPRLNPEEQKLALRHQLAQAALERLNRADVPRDELMERLRANYRRVLDSTATGLQELHGEGLPTQPAELDELEKYQLAAIAAQREALTLARKENIFDIELIRKQEARLDHEEARAEH